MSSPTLDARAITRASKSNLAFAFIALSRERREDITVFYAWCRLIDDIADEPGRPAADRRAALDRWRAALAAPDAGEPALAPQVRRLISKYRLRLEHFLAVIDGVTMDLDSVHYSTWEDLRLYCYRVASVVGLISIEIFGCQEAASRDYAVALGLALQLTNILRDVGADWRNGGRIYLPREDLDRFAYSPADLAAGHHSESFLNLMRFESKRARTYFAEAAALRPPRDRRCLVAAEIMGSIYLRLLDRLESRDFPVFTQRCRVGAGEKLLIAARVMLRSYFS